MPALSKLRPRLASTLSTLAILGCTAFAPLAFGQEALETSPQWSPWLPADYSTVGSGVDRLFYFVLYLTSATFVGVFAAMIYFLVKYRHQEGRRAKFIHGNDKLETVWTLIPTLILALIALFGQTTWSQIKTPQPNPTQAEVQNGEKVHMAVIAQQFQWNFQYPGADGILGERDMRKADPNGDPAAQIGLIREGAGKDDFVTPIMIIPVDTRIFIDLTSRDVIHSFFLPNFRIKQDAVPGLIGKVWFESVATSAEAMGTSPEEDPDLGYAKPFDIICAELCGMNHYAMRGQMYVVSSEEYKAFLAREAEYLAESLEEEEDDEGY